VIAKGRVDFQKGTLCFQRVVKYIANTRIDTHAYSREVILIVLIVVAAVFLKDIEWELLEGSTAVTSLLKDRCQEQERGEKDSLARPDRQESPACPPTPRPTSSFHFPPPNPTTIVPLTFRIHHRISFHSY
jgi:hypothetical protein